MRKIKPIMIMIISVIIFSCEKENLEIPQENGSPNGSALLLKGGDDPSAEDPLETMLQWTSFAAMEALFDNPETRLEFKAALDANNRVDVSDLLGSSSTTLNFKERWMEVMYTHIWWELNPGHPNGAKPKIPVVQNPPPPIGCFPEPCDEVQLYLDFFVSEITINNCIELYMPSDLDYSGNLKLTSTAHPLTTDLANEGFDIKMVLIGGDDSGGGTPYRVINNVERINDVYVIAHGNVIVARPFRPDVTVIGVPIGPCAYPSYPADFTLFLN